MKLIDLLKKFQAEKVPVVVNGIVGKITEVEDELITLETVRKKDKNLVKETTYMPTNQIQTVSTGEKPIPKSEVDVKIDEDLKGL